MTIMYVIGTGPTELHAQLDLQRRACDVDHHTVLTVLSTTHDAGHWSVLAEIQHDTMGEGR